LTNYRIEIEFIDGTSGKVDLSKLITGKKAGVFASLRDLKIFNQVHVHLDAVTWPGELDLAPDAMYDKIKNNKIWILE